MGRIERVRWWMRWLLRVSIAAGALWVAGCLAVYGAPLTAVIVAAIGPVALCPWTWPRRLAGVAWLGLAALCWSVPLHEHIDRTEALSNKVFTAGPGALTTRDRLGLYVLNLGMAAGGLMVGLPEVALETTLLAVPGPDTRQFQSCFASRSPRVAAVLDRQLAALPATGSDGEVVPLHSQRVMFPLQGSVPRVALALNPTQIAGTARWEGDHWAVDHTLTVPVDYPDRAALPLGRVHGRRLIIEEGLFDALEDLGWLHPYDGVWHCRVRHVPERDVATAR